MATVATAEVPIRPDTTGFGAILRAQLQKIRVDDIAKKKGVDFGDRFKQGFIGSGIGATIGRFTGYAAMIGSVAGPAAAAINGLAGAVSALGVGLGAGLTGALGGVAAGIGTIGQVAITAKIGLSGVSDAVKANVKVWDALAAGVEPTESQLKNAKIAMAKLSPEARDLVLAIGDMRAGFEKLKPSIQDSLVKGFGDALRNLSTTVLPKLNVALNATAIQMNAAAMGMLSFLTSSAAMSRLNSIFATNAVVVGQLSAMMNPLIAMVLGLVDAGGPLLVVLTGLVAKFVELTNNTLASMASSGKLTTLTLSLSVALTTLWDILGNLVGAIGNIFYAGLGPGNRMLDLLQQLTQKFQDWTASAEGQNAIQNFMSQGVDFFKQLGPLVLDIANAWKTLTAGADSTALIDGIRAILPPLSTILAQLSNPAVVEQFGVAFGQLADAFVEMNAGGAMAAFLGALGDMAQGVATIVTSVPGLTSVLGALATTAGVFAAVGFVSKLTIGPVVAAWQGFGSIVSGVSTAISAAGTAQTAFRVGMAGGELSKADGLWTNIGVGAGRATKAIGNAAKSVGNFALEMGKAVVAQAKMAVQTAIVTTKMLAQKAAQLAIKAATMAWTAVQWLLNVAMSANPIGIIIMAIVALVAAIVIAYQKSETFRAIVDAAFRAIGTALQWVWSVVQPILSALWSVIQTVFGAIVDAVKTAWNFVITILKTGFEFLHALFTGNWEKIGQMLSAAWDKFKEIIGKAWDAAIEAIGTGIKLAIDFIKELPGKIWSALSGLGSLLVGLGADLLRGLWNGISSMMTWLWNQVKGIGGWILDGLANLGDMMIDAGVSVVKGLWEGIKSMASWIYDKMIAFIKEVIPGPVLKVLGISSPSKLMMEYGKETGKGLALGILSTTDRVASATESLLSPLTSISPNFSATTGVSPYGLGAGEVPFAVNVYIGDERINEIIDLRVVRADENTARSLVAGRVGR